MKKENFTPATLSFEDIIDNSKIYKVPKYQRDYSWDNHGDEWELLWEDIISANNSHYAGILVLQENDQETSIIDGQQRLTTTTIIILAALYLLSEYANQLSNEQEKQQALKRLQILSDKYIGKTKEDLKYYNKITLNTNNKEYFSEISNVINNKKFQEIEENKSIKTNENLYKCLKYFYNKLKNHLQDIDTDKIIEFINNNIAKKLIFTTITVTKEENAYLLFETLNSRLVELTAYDLLKNHLLLKAGPEYEASMLQDLNEIIKNIGNHDITKFLALDWNSRHTPKVTTKRIYRIISSEINTTQDAFQYTQELKRSADAYNRIKRADVTDKETSELLKVLNYIPNVKQPYMILLPLIKNQKKYALKSILKSLLNLTIRYNYIAQDQANRQESVYNKIAYNISNKKYKNQKDILTDLRCADLTISDEHFINKFTKKNFNSEAIDRYILAKIQEKHNPHNKIDYDNETIEHITDKQLSPEYLNLFGNLTLLTKEDNGNLSGKTYAEKLEFYKTHDRYIVNMINAPEWNADTVEQRSKALADDANQIFRV